MSIEEFLTALESAAQKYALNVQTLPKNP